MASVRQRNGFLVVDFRYLGKRCREKTNLKDTSANRKKLDKIVEQMEAEMLLGSFDYAKYFPKSKRAKEMAALKNHVTVAQSKTPTFEAFADVWHTEKKVEWRFSYARSVKGHLNQYILPYFGKRILQEITRQEVLAFRTSLAKVRYGEANEPLKAVSINGIMLTLRMILDEAALRYDFVSPYKHIKNLKQPKPQVSPFTLDEVFLFLNNVRADYKNYYTVRFFTGMRTSEIDGLKWEYVDLKRKEIQIRETLVDGRMAFTKTRESSREITMSDLVYQALKKQYEVTYGKSDYVFCNRDGKPLNFRNVNRLVWHPTLKHLGLKRRRPYETRHTAATLWLSAGENPEWIARQMGHTTTKMLFDVYSRFVPDKTRQDGLALEMLVKAKQMAEQEVIETQELEVVL